MSGNIQFNNDQGDHLLRNYQVPGIIPDNIYAYLF